MAVSRLFIPLLNLRLAKHVLINYINSHMPSPNKIRVRIQPQNELLVIEYFTYTHNGQVYLAGAIIDSQSKCCHLTLCLHLMEPNFSIKRYSYL